MKKRGNQMSVSSFNCKENLFLAIHAAQFHVYGNFKKFYTLADADEPFFIQRRTIAEDKEHFWRIHCIEDPDVHEFIIERTNTPEPLNYTVVDHFYKGQHAIYSSTYRQKDLDIQSIMFYGYHEDERTFITEMILQFQSSYIHFVAGPIVDIFIKDGQFTKCSNNDAERILLL